MVNVEPVAENKPDAMTVQDTSNSPQVKENEEMNKNDNI